MTQEQHSLNEIYNVLLELKMRIQKIDDHLEDLDFINRTERAWQEIDEGKYTEYDSPEEFLRTFREKDAKDKRN